MMSTVCSMGKWSTDGDLRVIYFKVIEDLRCVYRNLSSSPPEPGVKTESRRPEVGEDAGLTTQARKPDMREVAGGWRGRSRPWDQTAVRFGQVSDVGVGALADGSAYTSSRATDDLAPKTHTPGFTNSGDMEQPSPSDSQSTGQPLDTHSTYTEPMAWSGVCVRLAAWAQHTTVPPSYSDDVHRMLHGKCSRDGDLRTTVRAGQLSDAVAGAVVGDLVYVYYVHDLATQIQAPNTTGG
ncbi:unnamed protein product [Schistocephalus solidus]|uniref:Uncharacterized protein n=1 Tax=Schistocephalus solidus TaxID=70667 RepID=A0A183S7Z5_SCHSO|nr:unnamed protein product [Schistocephalus solidus]